MGRHKTRREFLEKTAGSVAGVLFCAGLPTVFAADRKPHLPFPAEPQERIAIASYPFRDFVAGRNDKPGGKLELRDFAAHISTNFNIKKMEPWSKHFRSLDRGYLEELRAAVVKAGGAIVNIAVDGENSPYAVDPAERDRAVAFSRQWIDVAVSIGSPSVRTNIPPAIDAQPDVGRTAASLQRVVEYGALKGIVVNLENDNPKSEDPFFLEKVLEKVNSPWLYALPDFANTLAAYEEEYAYNGIEALFGKAYNISHVKETEVGDGKEKIAHVDLPRTFGIARKHAYKGFFSMEWDSPGDPYEGTKGLIEKTLKNLT